MRVLLGVAAALAVLLPAAAGAGGPSKRELPVVIRSASGTIIQPTRTIIHSRDGSTLVIVVPRRSYLDTGTELSVGDRSFHDYVMPPGGDPGRSTTFYGAPDVQGAGRYPLPGYSGMQIPGLNPSTPF
jgi:hypothetical protein